MDCYRNHKAMHAVASRPAFSGLGRALVEGCQLPTLESVMLSDGFVTGSGGAFCVKEKSTPIASSCGVSGRTHEIRLKGSWKCSKAGAWYDLGVQESSYGSSPVNKVKSAQDVGPRSCLSASPDFAVVRRTQQALKSRERRPKKWLGQHYMVDGVVNERIVEAANIQAGDVVLEIGPGTGALTDALTQAGARVVVVEKDPDMAALIEERFQNNDQVEVILKDILKWPVRSYMTESLQQGGSVDRAKYAKVVSNLPFNITSDVVKLLLPMGDLFSCVVLLLQDEAAIRLVKAAPKSPEYRSMSLFVNFYSKPDYRFQVKRASFYPSPNVDAALVRFDVRQASDYPAVSSPKGFFSMVNSAFQSKRKMLRTSLQHLYSPTEVQEALLRIDLPPTSRPDELSLEDFVSFFNACELGKQGQI